MANNKADSKSSKAMDVAKQGGSKPDDSSRPLILTHKTLAADPMVKEKDESSKSAVAEITPAPSKTEGGKVIQPPEDSKQEPDPKPEEENIPADSSPEPDKKDPEKQSAEEAAIVDAVAGQAEGKKKKDQPTEEEQKKLDEINKLIESKKYFVKVGQATKRRHNRQALAALSLILIGGAGVYLAIDAGLLDLGVKLPIEFIR